jgi:hypothetical protein
MANLKKRKMKKQDDDEPEPIICVHYERYDPDALEHLSQLYIRDPVIDSTLSYMNQKVNKPIKKGSIKHSTEKIEYRYAKQKLQGRVYGPCSLQSISKWIRKFLCGKYYHDLDFENSAPTVISQLCFKYLGHCPPLLKEY